MRQQTIASMRTQGRAVINSFQDTCIYCSEPVVLYQGEGDHVIPDALGRFRNQLKFWRICRSCNARIGQCEQHLLRCAPEALFRRIVQPNVTRNARSNGWAGADGLPPPKFTINHGDHLELVDASADDPLTVFAIDQLAIVDQEKGEFHIRLFPEMTLKSLRAKLDRLGLTSNNKVYLHADEMTSAKYIAFLKEIWPNSPFLEKEPCEAGVHQAPGRTYFKIHPDYWRAIAKIGFHYYLATTHRGVRGDESAFSDLRRYIMEGGNGESFFANPAARFGLPFGEFPNGDAILPETWAHALAATDSDERPVAMVTLFMGPKHLAPTYHINLGRFQRRLIVPGAVCAHAYLYDAGPTESTYAGQVVEKTMTRIR